MLQGWRKYFRERRLRKAVLRLNRERLAFLGIWPGVERRADWEILDFMAGIGGQHVEALYQARRHQEMMAGAGQYRGAIRG